MCKITTIGLFVAAAAAMGCQAPVETTPVETALEPAELPMHPAGSKWLYLRNGEEMEFELVSADDDEISGKTSLGCSWTRPKNMFAPATAFSNCNGNTGRQTLTDGGGKIWPLEIGNTQSWSVTGSNTKGDAWSTNRSCTVLSTERVKAPAGEFDTYKVVCHDKWRTRTWYYAPSIKSSVVFTNHHKERNATEKSELVSGPGVQ